jgi:hypothetical protein
LLQNCCAICDGSFVFFSDEPADALVLEGYAGWAVLAAAGVEARETGFLGAILGG